MAAAFRSFQADFPGLTMRLSTEPGDVDIDLEIPKQPGLEFDIDVNLQGDELQLAAGDHFVVEWFQPWNLGRCLRIVPALGNKGASAAEPAG